MGRTHKRRQGRRVRMLAFSSFTGKLEQRLSVLSENVTANCSVTMSMYGRWIDAEQARRTADAAYGTRTLMHERSLRRASPSHSGSIPPFWKTLEPSQFVPARRLAEGARLRRGDYRRPRLQ